MRIPVVLASVGPHESSWVYRRGLRTLEVVGSDGSLIVTQCECGRIHAFQGNGKHDLLCECPSLKLKHMSTTPVCVDLVNGTPN